MNKKEIAALKAVEEIKDGMIVGLGTGSTTYYALQRIGELCKRGLNIVGVPTSIETEKIAQCLGIPLMSIDDVDHIDVTIDGADEVDPDFRLIKGLGGALLREKIVAHLSRQEVIIVDDTKLVSALGTKSPLPVEVIPFGHKHTKKRLEELGCIAYLRGGEKPFVTDNGHYIYDCKFGRIETPGDLEKRLKSIPGVVETGLFIDIVTKIIIGTEQGVLVRFR
ncbi:MAG: ribose-5-phosphate isomerase RpiA [Methanomassiliicoccales archaeon]